MKKTLKNIARFLLFLAFGLFWVWFIIKDLTPAQWEKIRSAFEEANYWLLLPVLLIGGLSHFLRSLRWRLLIEPLGYKPTILNTFCAVMTGYLGNLALPRLGEIIRCGVLSRQERIPVNEVIGTMIAERAIDLICLMLLLFITIVTQMERIGHFFYQNVWIKVLDSYRESYSLWYFIVIGAGAIIVIAVVWKLLHFFKKNQWIRKIYELLKGVKKGILTALTLKRKTLFFIYTFLIWLCYFLMVYIGFYCFDAMKSLGIGAGLSVLSFGSIGMTLTQGGIGAYQLLVGKTLSLYQVSVVYGFAFSWLSWLTQTALILGLGVMSLVLLPFLKRDKPMVSPG